MADKKNWLHLLAYVTGSIPEECRYVLETLGGVYHNDAVSRERELSPEDRLRFHQEHSGPLMKGLHEWMEAQLAEHKTEPNSGTGQSDLLFTESLAETDAFRGWNNLPLRNMMNLSWPERKVFGQS